MKYINTEFETRITIVPESVVLQAAVMLRNVTQLGTRRFRVTIRSVTGVQRTESAAKEAAAR